MLRLSPEARGSTTVGEILNLMSVDSQRLLFYIQGYNLFAFNIPAIIFGMLLLYWQVIKLICLFVLRKNSIFLWHVF